MLITKEVEINLTGSIVKHYEELAYEIPRVKDKQYRMKIPIGTKLLVKVEDLPIGSNIKIDCLCEYCLEENINTIISMSYQNYLKILNQKNPKICCKKCSGKKISEGQLKYSYEDMSKLFETNGFKVLLSKDKCKFCRIEKRRKVFLKLDKASCSTQQKYLHNLLGGELNYPCKKYFLDIAFPDDMIYIEYNGGAHDRKVKIGEMSEECFIKKETERNEFLYKLGWRKIEINSKNDYIAQDNIILNEIHKAKRSFNKGCFYYFINFNSKIMDEKFGKLRRINKNDLINYQYNYKEVM